MLRAFIGLTLLALTSAAAGAAPFGRPACCEVFIYEPPLVVAESYAIRSRATGRAVVVEMAAGQTPKLVEGAAARTLVAGWLAEARAGRLSKITLEGPDNQIILDPFDAPEEDPDGSEDVDKEDVEEAEQQPDTRGSLIHIRRFRAAKTSAFVDQIPYLPTDANTRMKALIVAR